MAKKISQLTTASGTTDSDIYPIVQSGSNKRLTGKQVSQHYSDFTTLAGTTWDGSNKVLDLTANKSLSLSPGTNRVGWLIAIQDATGGRTLSIEGNSVAIDTNPNAVTIITYVWDAAKSKYRFLVGASPFSVTGSASDTTAPTVSSRATGSTTTIVITFSENVTSTTAGWSFKKNGSNLSISSVSGSGTNQLTFTVATMAGGDTLLCSYSSGSGDCKDAANNVLASFTDQSVTNGIGATQLTAPGSFAHGTESSGIMPLSWTDTNTSPNESSLEIQVSQDNTFATGVSTITPAADATSANFNSGGTTGTWYARMRAKGNGTSTTDSDWTSTISFTISNATYIAFTSAGSPNRITESPTGTWTTVDGSNGFGVATTDSLASSANGHIQAKYIDSSNGGAVIGLDAVNSATDYDQFDYGLYVSAGTYRRIDNGTITDTGIAVTANDYYRLARSGGNTIKAEKSADGVTWTTIHTFATTTTAELFPKITIVINGNKASEVKGVGLS